MCGDEIDLSDEWTIKNSVVAHNTYYTPVQYHNPAYATGYEDGIGMEFLDLCPACADRATAIHLEVTGDYKTGWHHEYSWREGR